MVWERTFNFILGLEMGTNNDNDDDDILGLLVDDSIRLLITGFFSNLANAASLLWYAFKSMPGASRYVNWAGERENSFVGNA